MLRAVITWRRAAASWSLRDALHSKATITARKPEAKATWVNPKVEASLVLPHVAVTKYRVTWKSPKAVNVYVDPDTKNSWFADSFSVSDQLSVDFSTTLLDGVTVAEALAFGLSMPLTDSVNVTDAFSSVWTAFVALADSVTASEVSQTFNYGKVLSDAVTIDDSGITVVLIKAVDGVVNGAAINESDLNG